MPNPQDIADDPGKPKESRPQMMDGRSPRILTNEEIDRLLGPVDPFGSDGDFDTESVSDWQARAMEAETAYRSLKELAIDQQKRDRERAEKAEAELAKVSVLHGLTCDERDQLREVIAVIRAPAEAEDREARWYVEYRLYVEMEHAMLRHWRSQRAAFAAQIDTDAQILERVAAVERSLGN